MKAAICSKIFKLKELEYNAENIAESRKIFEKITNIWKTGSEQRHI